MTAHENSLRYYRRERERGAAFDKLWREVIRPALSHPAGYGGCHRCDGAGVVMWLGKPGEGGRKGPCPRCRVEAAAQFRKQHRKEIFGGL